MNVKCLRCNCQLLYHSVWCIRGNVKRDVISSKVAGSRPCSPGTLFTEILRSLPLSCWVLVASIKRNLNTIHTVIIKIFFYTNLPVVGFAFILYLIRWLYTQLGPLGFNIPKHTDNIYVLVAQNNSYFHLCALVEI